MVWPSDTATANSSGRYARDVTWRNGVSDSGSLLGTIFGGNPSVGQSEPAITVTNPVTWSIDKIWLAKLCRVERIIDPLDVHVASVISNFLSFRNGNVLSSPTKCKN